MTVAISISAGQGVALCGVVVGVCRVSVWPHDDVRVGKACTLGASALGRGLGLGVWSEESGKEKW